MVELRFRVGRGFKGIYGLGLCNIFRVGIWDYGLIISI